LRWVAAAKILSRTECRNRPRATTRFKLLTRPRSLIAFGDMRAVQCAFGIDAAHAVMLPSSSARRHHDPAVAGQSIYLWGRRQFSGWQTQAGEQQATTRTSGVPLPGRRSPDDGAVGPLFIAPAVGTCPKCFKQVVAA
jgi:hypothetical protein